MQICSLLVGFESRVIVVQVHGINFGHCSLPPLPSPPLMLSRLTNQPPVELPRLLSKKVICIKMGKEVVPYSDRIMNILVEVFKNKQAVAQVRDTTLVIARPRTPSPCSSGGVCLIKLRRGEGVCLTVVAPVRLPAIVSEIAWHRRDRPMFFCTI